MGVFPQNPEGSSAYLQELPTTADGRRKTLGRLSVKIEMSWIPPTLLVRTKVACFLLLFLIPTLYPKRVSGQGFGREPSLQASLDRLSKEENQVYELESRGRERQALSAAIELLDHTISQIETANDPGGKKVLTARAVAGVFLIEGLATSTGQPDVAAAALLMLRDRVPDGILKGRIDAELRALARRSRTTPVTPAELEDLERRGGFITSWLIIGPFDNERGSGFSRNYPPEKGFDPAAEYPGKAHPVSWRDLPQSPKEVVDFAALFSPREQCLSYALTSIWVEEDRDLALRIGSDEGVKVWVNDVLVHENDVRRPLRLDQDSFGVRLSGGWNKVLVKVGQRANQWGFSFRLTQPSGAPFEEFKVEASRDHLDRLSRGEEISYPSGSARRAKVEKGAIDWLTQDLRERDTDPRTHHTLALLHLVLHPTDVGDLVPYRHAIQAAQLEPDNPHVVYLAALTSGRRAGLQPEMEENKKRNLLQRVVAMDPGHIQALLQLANYYMTSLDAPRKTRELIQRARRGGKEIIEQGKILPDRVANAEVLHVRWLRRRGFDVQADSLVKELAESGDAIALSPKVIQARAEALVAGNRVNEAIELFKFQLGRNLTDPTLRTRLVNLLRVSGRTSESVSVLRDAIARNPFDLAARVLLSTVLQNLEDYEGALSTLLESRKYSPQSAPLLAEIGELLHRLGRTEEAREHLQASLTLDPNHSQVRRYLDYLQQVDREFQNDFPLDVEPLVREAASIQARRNEPYSYVLRREIVKVNPDGRALRYQQLLVKILTDRGIRDFDIYPVSFAVGEQEVRVLVNRVHHADGTMTSGATRSHSVRGTGSRDDRRLTRRYVDFPPLRVGDVVEVAYRLDDRRQSFFGDYFGMEFQFQETDLVPVRQSSLILVAPKGRDLYFHQMNGAPEGEVLVGADEEKIHYFSMRDLDGIEGESFMPPARELVPTLQISTYGSWDDFAAWWWSLIKKEGQVDPDLEGVITDLTRAARNRDLLETFYAFVASDIRYVAWEFGVHGYKPYNASTIFARRFGDCKDKSILLNTMLGRQGVPAYPTLLFSGDVPMRQDLTLPLVSHFNHCISYVPNPSPGSAGQFLDGTAEFSGVKDLPSGDRGRGSLVVKEGVAEIIRIPEAKPEENQFVRELKIDLSLSGPSRIQGRFAATGDFAALTRQRYRNTDKSPSVLESVFTNRIGQTKVRSSFFSDMSDLSIPVEFGFELAVEGVAVAGAQELFIPAVRFPSDFSAYSAANSRRFDLVLPAPFRRLEETVLSLPENVELLELPENIMMEEPFARYELLFEMRGENEIVIRRDLALSHRRVSSSDYPAFREFSLQMARGEERRIRLRRKKEQ